MLKRLYILLIIFFCIISSLYLVANANEKIPLIAADGWNGVIKVYDNKVKIERKQKIILGISNFIQADKEIRIKDISGIQFKKAGSIVGGYIRFSIPGAGEITNVNIDENAIVFTRKDQADFEEVKRVIENQMNKITENNIPAYNSNLDEIEKLARLLEKGLITQEEFTLKKKQLLGL